MGTVITATEDVCWLRVEEQSAVGDVRRAIGRAATSMGFSADRVGEVELAATELATNAVRHATMSSVLVRARRAAPALDAAHDGPPSALDTVELVMIDAGPGMVDVAQSRRDGTSDKGTLGIGLGVIERVAARMEVYSERERGSVIVAAFDRDHTAILEPDVDGLTRPITGESVCGDAWAAVADAERIAVILADGLGHGALAAEASQRAVEEFRNDPQRRPVDVLRAVHTRLAGTRGAAVSVLDIDRRTGAVRFAGVGNVTGRMVAFDRARGLAPQPGIVGQHVGSPREQTATVEPGDLVIVHSDGLTSKWDLAEHRGLFVAAPDVIAAVLLRDAGLRQDDASVVVARV